ncbi:hypothetical protein J7297_05227 [Nakaseomyces glabratus]|nr:hypothetical protein J7297_05227 [Nakaseomyces glabratus]KAH7579825.1 hypothetical protein J7298_05224 [Nakaseomyces glabratus]KAH7580450.1 hypothetical protein J7296_05204 [Nakaseomyces glabratus]KAH7593006.1 hypothetical protein J7295_05219 [Nakaseomyces glabratus]KAH7610850.1 hypothetical protein J7292_05195 [Nakaseomyces glabratus]
MQEEFCKNKNQGHFWEVLVFGGKWNCISTVVISQIGYYEIGELLHSKRSKNNNHQHREITTICSFDTVSMRYLPGKTP